MYLHREHIIAILFSVLHTGGVVTADRSCLHCAGCRWRQKPLCGGCLALRTKPCFEQCPQPAHLFPWQMCCTACIPTCLSHVSEAVSASCSGARMADALIHSSLANCQQLFSSWHTPAHILAALLQWIQENKGTSYMCFRP